MDSLDDLNKGKVDLTGRRVFIVGASRGIGYQTALHMAKAGADVAVAARSIDPLRELSDRIRALGRESLALSLDILNVKSIEQGFERVQAEFGSLDTVVISAGVSVRSNIVDMKEEDYDRVVGTNLKGPYFCCREAGRILLPQGKGSVILIGSLADHFGMNQVSAYSVSKGGVAQLTKCLAVEWGKYGVRVNAVSPGFVATEMTSASLSIESRRNWIMGRTPMQRLGSTSEISEAISFLASDAASFITGHMLNVDGGFTAGSEW